MDKRTDVINCKERAISVRQRIELLIAEKIVIVENIRLVRLLDLTADFGVKTNAKLTPIFKLQE